MTPRERERRLYAAEGKAGIRRKPPCDVRQAQELDDWLKSTTGKCISEMSCDELRRLEQLFRGHADAGAAADDDAAELVRGCLDENQTVIDLERRRQQMDQGPWR